MLVSVIVSVILVFVVCWSYAVWVCCSVCPGFLVAMKSSFAFSYSSLVFRPWLLFGFLSSAILASGIILAVISKHPWGCLTYARFKSLLSPLEEVEKQF